MKQWKKQQWIERTKITLVALILVFLLHSFVFATSLVEGQSMNPTIEDGERLIYNKLAYLINEPSHGDIIIIKRPLKNYVKRVIGLPNETITILNQQLYINGMAYKQAFLNDSDENFFTPDFGPITVPENSYFVMGDNRQASKDSRNGLGFITRDEIIGRSEVIIYPYSEWALLD